MKLLNEEIKFVRSDHMLKWELRWRGHLIGRAANLDQAKELLNQMVINMLEQAKKERG